MSTTRKITIRKDGGADVGPAERINLITGANVTWTVAIDAANKEIDVTLASAPGSQAWLDQFFPAVAPDDFHGTYPVVSMFDAEDTTIYQTILIPDDVVTIDTAIIIIIPNGTGNVRWECATNFAQICIGENYQLHTDSIAANDTGVTSGDVECIDISAAFDGATGNDLVGVMWKRLGSHDNDTVDAPVYYIGILIQGST